MWAQDARGHDRWTSLVKNMNGSAAESRKIAPRTLGEVIRRFLLAGGTTAKVDLTTGAMLGWGPNLAAGTVAKAVEALRNEHLIQAGAKHTTGRSGPIAPLRFGSDAWCVAGVNVFRRNRELKMMHGVLARLDGSVLVEEGSQADVQEDGEVQLAQGIQDLVATLQLKAQASGYDTGMLLGVGISTSGVVRPDGTVVYAGSDALHIADLGNQLRRLMADPVVIENDINAHALAAYYAKRVWQRDVAFVDVHDAGIGGALIVGGRLHRGATGMAMEPGHLTVEQVARPASTNPAHPAERGFNDACWCSDNAYGHLECLGTPSRIRGELQVKDLSEVGRRPALVPDPENPNSLTVSDAVPTFRRAGAALGSALEHIINVVNPSQLLLRLPEMLADPDPQSNAAQYRDSWESSLRKAFTASTVDSDSIDHRVVVDSLDLDNLPADNARSAMISLLHGFVEHLRGNDGCPPIARSL